MESFNVTKVGAVLNPDAKRVRIVHISDTHGRHLDFLKSGGIPPGDILVHSGDFGCFSFTKLFKRRSTLQEELDSLNDFFHNVPHRHKIFVAGNHELHFTSLSHRQLQSQLTHCVYLQDSDVTIEGIKFYGSPWNGRRWCSFARGFAVSYGKTLGKHWRSIPDDADVMITHNPPHGVMDLSRDKSLLKDRRSCSVCGEVHPGWCHWGCEYLKRILLQRVRPTLHLFGHCHERNGITSEDGVVFSNAAMKLIPMANVIDFYVLPANLTHS